MNLFDVYQQYDINLVGGKACQLQDDKGNEYIDFYGGHGVISIGHSHPHYLFRIENQLHCLGFYSNAVQNNLQKKLATKLGEVSAYPKHQLFLCNSGAEANENALKLASFHTGKSKVIAMKGAFHGRTSGTLAITDNKSLSANYNSTHEVVFIDLNDTETLTAEMSKGDVAAIIVEGIQGVNGVYELEKSFLNIAKSLCEQYKALLIVDEIQSGYGRTGKFFAHQHTGIEADLITCAKGMGNGFPIAGVLISPKIKAKKGMLGTTFGGNHLACAAALAVLECIEEENLMENAQQIGNYLMEELQNISAIKEIRGKGLMIGIDLENRSAIRKRLLEEYGFFTGASGDHTLRLLPPLSVSKEFASQFVLAVTKIIND